MQQGEEQARTLLDIMRNNYDMIWQDGDWYIFSNIANEYANEFSYIDEQTSSVLKKQLIDYEDGPNQEAWFDIADNMGLLIFNVAKVNHFIDNLIRDYPEYYGIE